MSTSPTAPVSGPWWRELNRYHWFVLIVAALGWLFDTMDQQLFNLARVPAMRSLLKPGEDVALYSGYSTAIFLIGWATGGLTFGVLGDRIGRAKTMMWTILIYSICTGLSALSVGFWDFAFYRFITGLGVGGEFAVGVSLVAEVMPDKARPHALGLLQALSAVGNVSAALISMGLGHLEESGAIGSAWRWMFVIGAVPALLALVIRSRLKEPERWTAARAAQQASGRKQMGSYEELFGNANWKRPAAIAAGFIVAIIAMAFFGSSSLPKLKIGIGLAIGAIAAGLWTVYGGNGDTRWRRNAMIGLLLALSGIIGLWGIGFFSIDLVRSVFQKSFAAEGMDPARIPGAVTFWAGVATMMLNVGTFLGITAFSHVSQRIGRRPTFAICFVLALLSTAMVFLFLKERSQIFWMMPVMGFCQLSLFGGYAIYFPELFPTRLRSTGISFCYNVGRFAAASGPAVLGLLTSQVYKDQPEPMRYAGLTMCAVFLLGLIVLPFAPETRNQPLPEDERGFAH
ncbi:MFS transporter [Horticoccus sp. 23ND18S-11]|uniref:MFS transporter n=1 Tax=Horticoccus sp. 23ND18S-11 TaxID=3391832 RepID=UPI0039C8ED04